MKKLPKNQTRDSLNHRNIQIFALKMKPKLEYLLSPRMYLDGARRMDRGENPSFGAGGHSLNIEMTTECNKVAANEIL